MSRKFLISLVRHGETMENRQKIMQGQLDTKLSDVGVKQAQLLANRLKNDRFTHVYSSDLARAADTAWAIVETNKSFSAHLTLDRRLRERGFGNLEGKLLPEYKKAAEKANVPMQDYTPEGGETIEQVTARAKDFFEELCKLMAEPLLDLKSTSPLGLGKSISHHGSSSSCQHSDTQVTSVTQAVSAPQLSSVHRGTYLTHILMQEEQKREAQPSQQPLSIDIPVCYKSPPSEVIVANGIHESVAGPVKESTPGVCSTGLDISKPQSSYSVHDPSVLIVSHGLLLRELKRLILKSYSGQLEGNLAKEARLICPNTGLSQFGMSVSVQGNSVVTKCEHVYVINDTQHLVSSSEDLLTKFQGAL
ncbi:unnamed protein product [Candidula unifasciata]|uniref:Fructose-2,6-bisphosphatase TIGAR n=1 Tax=Candidula unifasciata TaxID=100452 RepID=A0A8S4A4I9_9EUPU|nr:unnamed protein product [Candidula unifasciata]